VTNDGDGRLRYRGQFGEAGARVNGHTDRATCAPRPVTKKSPQHPHARSIERAELQLVRGEQRQDVARHPDRPGRDGEVQGRSERGEHQRVRISLEPARKVDELPPQARAIPFPTQRFHPALVRRAKARSKDRGRCVHLDSPGRQQRPKAWNHTRQMSVRASRATRRRDDERLAGHHA
jgi:hypothetical protein